jgi:hypothetical protein
LISHLFLVATIPPQQYEPVHWLESLGAVSQVHLTQSLSL